jgi:hypothetical protein
VKQISLANKLNSCETEYLLKQVICKLFVMLLIGIVLIWVTSDKWVISDLWRSPSVKNSFIVSGFNSRHRQKNIFFFCLCSIWIQISRVLLLEHYLIIYKYQWCWNPQGMLQKKHLTTICMWRGTISHQIDTSRYLLDISVWLDIKKTTICFFKTLR